MGGQKSGGSRRVKLPRSRLVSAVCFYFCPNSTLFFKRFQSLAPSRAQEITGTQKGIGNWFLRYLAHIIGAKPSEMEKWFELKVIFFNMIFAFCRSAAFVEAQASHSTVIPCGKGRGRRQWPVFTGTVSFGFTVLGSAVSIVRKEILLVRPLMSMRHWLNSIT